MHIQATALHLRDKSTEFGSMDWVEFCARARAANSDVVKVNERRERMTEVVELGRL